jgi:hypothetical protein
MTVTIKIDNPNNQNQNPSIGISCAVRSGAVSPRFSTEMVARVASKEVFTSTAAKTSEDNHRTSVAKPNERKYADHFCKNFSKNRTSAKTTVNLKAKIPIGPKTCLPVISRFGKANIIRGVLNISMLINGKFMPISRKPSATIPSHRVGMANNLVVVRFISWALSP